MKILGQELGFWLVVMLAGVAGVGLAKIIAAQPWAPDGLAKLGGHL